MKTVSAESALAKIYKYLENDVVTPFFVVVDDSAEYLKIVTSLGSLTQMRVSAYCAQSDSYPNIDKLCDTLTAVTENTLLLGFGESISLSGYENVIGRLKDLNVTAKIVVVCRGIRAAVNSFCKTDKKFNSRRVCFLKSGTSYVIKKVSPSIGITAIDGFRELICRLEDGASGTLFVNTTLNLNNVREVSAYDVLREEKPDYMVPRTCLPDNLWAEFIADNNLNGFDLLHWRTYIKLKHESTQNKYLKYVVDTSDNYEVYKKRVFYALLDYSVCDEDFQEVYAARKMLLKDVRSSDIADYIAETKVKDDERLYYLTDNTSAEKQAIIESLDGMTIIPLEIKYIYPALHEYLQDFIFSGEIGTLLTDYFSDYKRLKLTNRITPKFYNQVLSLAADGSRPYNGLKTRGELLDSLNKANSLLFWIDALGVEYLGYIQSRAKALELKITVYTVRANLPTITSLNSDFYEAWNGEKTKLKELDKIKHEGEQDFNYQTVKAPAHLSEELRILDEALEWIKTKLSGQKCDKVIIVSDHGASRLAVINNQECKWEMKSKGKHSGRCCPISEADVKSEYATQENGFWVLANYDRFKGGRKASVEVHGGATLEEVVIPVIEVELFDSKIEVRNITPITTASYKKNAEIVLFSKSTLLNVSVRVLGKQYYAEAMGNNKHKIIFPDIKRAGKYTSEVFEGDNLIGQVEFEVQRESVKIHDSDWF